MTAVIAVRSGSQRCINKNIRPFAGSNLLELKINLLKRVKGIDEIIVNSDCDRMLSIGERYGCKTHEREAFYASSAASNSDFHYNIAKTTDTDFIFLTPVCAPCVSIETHEKAIDFFLNSAYDSVTSYDSIQNHLWQNGKPLNYDLDNVGGSQDMEEIKRLNYGIAIIEKDSMLKNKRLIGNNPYLYKLDEIESIDIDTEQEFIIAEQVYKSVVSKRITDEYPDYFY